MISVWLKKVELTDSFHRLRIKWLKWSLESPVPFWNHHPWMCSKALRMGTGHSGAGAMLGLRGLRGIFQPQWCHLGSERRVGKEKRRKKILKVRIKAKREGSERKQQNCCLNMWPKPAEEETEVYSAVTSKAVKTEGKKPVLLKNKKNCP